MLGGALLELLCAFQEQGCPPLPCYSAEQELQRCLKGPNRMLRGVAARLSGNVLMRGGNEDGALGLYQDSLALLEKIGCPLEAAKTRLALASLALRRNDKEKAVLLVSDAWPMYDCLKDFFWPEELLALLPSYMRKHGDANLSSRALLEAYRESFSPTGHGNSSRHFRRLCWRSRPASSVLRRDTSFMSRIHMRRSALWPFSEASSNP